MSAFPEAAAAVADELAPVFFSKIFQNFKLSSAARGCQQGSSQIDTSALTGCGQHLSVRAQAAVEDSGLMSRDLDVAHQRRIAPDAEGVVGEAAGADDLLVVGAPPKAGNLRPSVDAVHSCAGGGVPEVDVTVV
jgi:hypothetical protein